MPDLPGYISDTEIYYGEAEVPPVHVESFQPPKNPDVWLELRIEAYPDHEVTVYNFSTRAMAYPTMIEGRVVSNGWSTVESALSDWRGSREASVISATLEDADGLIRQLSSQIGLTLFANSESSLKLLSEEGRKDGLEPRIIHRGYLVESPLPKSGRKAFLEVVDVLGSNFFHLNPEATIQRVFFSREFLDAAGFENTPKHTIDKTPAIIIGEQSDEGLVDQHGNSAAKGTVPVIDLGDYNFGDEDRETIPPPVLTATVVGTAGTETKHYAVSFVTTLGETVWSNTVTITNSLPDGARNHTNYNHLTWRAPDGEAADGTSWHDVYVAQNIITSNDEDGAWFRVGGRSTDPPTKYLDAHTGGEGTIEDPWYYNDGELAGRDSFDSEKSPAAPDYGTAFYGGDVWGVFCWAMGYTSLTSIYGSNLAELTEPKRVKLDPEYPDILVPASTGWPYPDPWVEVNAPNEVDGDTVIPTTVRLSIFFARGNILKQHREGNVTFAVNCCGLTDTGDDTGTQISEAADGYALLINEFILKDRGRGYRTGDFWPIEEFADGVPILEMDIIRQFQTDTISFIGGDGYQMNLILTEATTLSQFEQWFCNTFNCYVGSTDNGQQGVWTINDNIDIGTVRHLRQHIELPQRLDDPNIAEDEIENKISYHYHYDADANEYMGDVNIVKDPVSIQIYGVRMTGSEPLQLRCTADKTTAADAMFRRLYHNSVHPLYQPITTAPNPGYELSKGGYIRVTHTDGIGVDGYDNHAFFIIRKRFVINKPHAGVEFVVRDINRLIGPASSWIGDEEIYNDIDAWDIMGDDGEFGIMGDETEWSHA